MYFLDPNAFSPAVNLVQNYWHIEEFHGSKTSFLVLFFCLKKYKNFKGWPFYPQLLKRVLKICIWYTKDWKRGLFTKMREDYKQFFVSYHQIGWNLTLTTKNRSISFNRWSEGKNVTSSVKVLTTTTTIFICTLALCEVHCKNIRNKIRVLAAWNNHGG